MPNCASALSASLSQHLRHRQDDSVQLDVILQALGTLLRIMAPAPATVWVAVALTTAACPSSLCAAGVRLLSHCTPVVLARTEAVEQAAPVSFLRERAFSGVASLLLHVIAHDRTLLQDALDLLGALLPCPSTLVVGDAGTRARVLTSCLVVAWTLRSAVPSTVVAGLRWTFPRSCEALATAGVEPVVTAIPAVAAELLPEHAPGIADQLAAMAAVRFYRPGALAVLLALQASDASHALLRCSRTLLMVRRRSLPSPFSLLSYTPFLVLGPAELRRPTDVGSTAPSTGVVDSVFL